ncbi:CDP-alcohol phosphatidyltransferase family protein [Actinocrispum wychmicini]|uniref:CDP-alcohol phosphatidyltransferase-like enzyme n=1 Tax=Actinocrispum wychmicini TaxID=1213861 RepID=A0A4R2IX30_9PSEU|nr:CDP-alcohol phosphatidyltransferase family protein [Actinocrispum wychmicini]TCO48798.1 CDP-alcohol phosphatidyltransferase-like enzyme [Actinocrispum wychmicini]
MALAAGAIAEVVLLAILSLAAGLGVLGWLAGTVYSAVLITALYRSGAARLGPADYVTLARATLVGCVTAMIADAFHQSPPIPLMVVIASVALVLDAVDGKVARRTGTVSPLGARFDMEVDAFLILVLSAFVASTHGWWVLTIGLMRYAYVAAGWFLPWLRGSLAPSMARKTVAAVQGVVLVVAASGILPLSVSVTLVGFAWFALAWSFTDSVMLLYPRRERQLVTSFVAKFAHAAPKNKPM